MNKNLLRFVLSCWYTLYNIVFYTSLLLSCAPEVPLVLYLFLLVSLVWLWAGLHMGYRYLWMLILYVIFNCLLVSSFVYLSVCLRACLPTYLFIHLSIYFSNTLINGSISWLVLQSLLYCIPLLIVHCANEVNELICCLSSLLISSLVLSSFSLVPSTYISVVIFASAVLWSETNIKKQIWCAPPSLKCVWEFVCQAFPSLILSLKLHFYFVI